MLKRIPHTFTIIALFILLCAALSWVVPAGSYDRQIVEVDGVKRTVIVDHSFHAVEQTPQSWEVFASLFDGFERQAGIIAFILIIGGAFHIINSTRSIDVGIYSFLRFTKRFDRNPLIRRVGSDNLIISLVIIFFSLFGSVFGMSEETLAFSAIIIPLAISLGYDSLTGICMVYVAAHVGFAGATLNPFTIGIAQGLSDVPLFSGIEYRLFCWVLLTMLTIVGVLWYGHRVKRNPKLSPMYEADKYWRDRELLEADDEEQRSYRSTWVVYLLTSVALLCFAWHYPSSHLALANSRFELPMIPVLAGLFVVTGIPSLRKSYHFFVLHLLAFAILFLIVGVLGHGWYISEISALFLALGLLSGFAASKSVDELIGLFTYGCKDILSVAIVVGLAGGIIVILEQGHVIDPMLYALSEMMSEAGKIATVGGMYITQTLINIIIPSGSAKAALTMPIMAPFSDVVGISRQATVMAFQFGDGFTNMITPTSAVLMGVLGIARIPYALWVRWFGWTLLALIVLGFLLLVPTVLMPLNGF